MVYEVSELIEQLNSPYKQDTSDSFLPSPLGSETIHLRMRYQDHDAINTRTLDATGNGNHADFLDEPTFIVGRGGRAYEFDGSNDGLQVPHAATLNSGAFTMSMLLRVDDDPADGDRIVGRGLDEAFRVRFDASRDILFEVFESGGTVGGTATLAKVDYSINKWFVLTVIFTGTRVKVYKDGVLEDDQAFTGTLKTATTDLFLACQNSGANHAAVSLNDFRFVPAAVSTSSLSSLVPVEHPTNNAKYIQAWHTAFWEQFEGDLEFIKDQAYVPTATGKFLDRHGEPTQTTRRPAEGDPSYRVRIIGARRRLLGAVTIEDVIEVVETVTGAAGQGNVQVIPHIREDGGYEPAFFRVQTTTSFLKSKGFTSDQFSDVLAELEDILNEVVAAGVRVRVVVRTASKWDNNDDWDDPDSIWGT